MPETPTLYGLLIAIDDYPSPVPPLGGCVNDIRKVKAYLEGGQKSLPPKLLVLENEAATKQAIVDGFRKHLGQAGSGDTALVYFSGHGTQEDADPGIWPFETDGKLECIVNYDGIVQTDKGMTYNLLADKELRFLLHELAATGAHVITIFDCCHSGGNTREAKIGEGQQKAASRRYVTSRLTKACPKRSWDQFLFSPVVDPAALGRQPLSEVIPVGQHVQMGACRSDQLAYEVDGGGVFTSTLLSLLESTRGEISYFDLRSRIRYMVKNDYQQTPQVYVQGRENTQLFSGFLGRAVSRQANEGNVVYNNTDGWILDLGAMHGLAPDLLSLEVSDDAGALRFPAKVQAVKMSHTRLLIEDQEVLGQLDTKKGYRAVVPGALAQPIRVYLLGGAGAQAGEELLQKALTGMADRLVLVESEQEADYVVRIQDQGYAITPAFDPGRPVVKPVTGWTARTADVIAIYLRNIAKWTFVRDLHNPNVRLFEQSPIEIRFFMVNPDQSQQPLEIKGEELVLPYRKLPDGQWGNAIRIQITNRHSSRLYCSLIYLSETFQIYSSLLGEPVVFLEPGASAWAFDGGDVELDLAPHITAYGWPNSFVWLKFLVSTDEFDPSTFDQEALPMPTDGDTRGIKLASPAKLQASDWTAQLVQIRMPNPELA